MGLTNLRSRDCGGPFVFHWFSPFPLQTSLEERLGAAGLRPAAANGEVSIDLLLYDTPDAVLNRWRQRGQSAPSTQALAEGYRRLSQLRDGTRLISTWRLCQLNAEALLAWLHGQADCPTLDTPPPVMDALSGVVTRRLLELQADALEAYLDLELQAELAGTRPDSNYIARLDNNADGATLLEDWWQMAEQAATANQLTGEVAHIQGEKDVLAKERDAALQWAEELKQQLGSQAESLKEAQDESQATLLQLHQVQEVLERYFLKHREQDEQLQTLEGQLTELRREQAAISQARDAALEATANLTQQLATQHEALHLAQAKGEQQAGQLQVLEADAARWKDKAETANLQHTAAKQHIVDLEQQLASQAEALREAQEENQATLLQLLQVQEELERYFLRSSAGDELCRAQAQENSRAMGLLGRMIRLQAGL
jgi:hypothetical protein